MPKVEFAALVKKGNFLDGTNDEAAVVEMRNRFKVGDTLTLVSPNDNHGKSFVVERIINSKGEEIDDAKIVQEQVTVFAPFKIDEGDVLQITRQ